eukprot:m.69688 g.69688  ORF g.69688 m.69688 type:complete len:273 (+) comp12843_c0_seq5:909-1727(+)
MCSRPPQPAPPAILHSALLPVASLLGTWQGKGAGKYPTIEPFEYEEELTFTHVGKPFFEMKQRTWHPVSKLPMHTETGYLRMTPRGPELVVSDPTGLAEVYSGSVQRDGEALVLAFESSAIQKTATAKEVSSMTRTLRLAPDVSGSLLLTCSLAMAAVGQPLQEHLTSTLALSPAISAAQAKSLLPHATLIDCRNADEVASLSGLPGARHVPLDVLLSGSIQETLPDLDKSKPVVVYCHSGRRSLRAATFLRQHQIPALSLEGGLAAWPASP